MAVFSVNLFDRTFFTKIPSMIMIDLLGIVGATKTNYCLLMGFCIILALIVLTEVGLAISLFALANHGLLDQVVGDTMRQSLNHFNVEGYEGVTKGMYVL